MDMHSSPFTLSLSKGSWSLLGTGFDKLSPNGFETYFP
jgi:hypothetical protein